MDGPRVHLCNASLECVTKKVKAGCEWTERRRRVHLCNGCGTSLGVSLALESAIAITICRMCFAVAPPVGGVPGTPSDLGSGLICTVVGICPHARALPDPSPCELAGLHRAVALIRNVCERSERRAAGSACADRFHGRAPRASKRAPVVFEAIGSWCGALSRGPLRHALRNFHVL